MVKPIKLYICPNCGQVISIFNSIDSEDYDCPKCFTTLILNERGNSAKL